MAEGSGGLDFTDTEKFEVWMTFAQIAKDGANGLYETGNWLLAAIMAQQYLEKTAKGIFGLYLGYDKPVMTHNIIDVLNFFLKKIPAFLPHRHRRLFNYLFFLFTNFRYPDFSKVLSIKHDLTVKHIGREQTEELLGRCEEAYKWLMTLKPSKGK
ncbi:MAG: HEPN domain-containing protein [Deltaproteobacteria bacterium]|jgi:HEPN domain-containing protein|nr:HEPN domain-containing protein [Deltaproteobacteria bacterium]